MFRKLHLLGWILTDNIDLRGSRSPHPEIHEAEQEEEQAGRHEQEHGQVVGAEPPTTGGRPHLLPLELLEQLILRHRVLLLETRLAVGMVGTAMI